MKTRVMSVALMFAAVSVLAAEAITPPDFMGVGAKAIVALTPVLSVIVLWALKLAWAQVPASVVLLAAPFLSMGIDYFLSWLAGHPSSNPLIAASLGAVAVYLREFASTVLSKGLLGSVSVTKGMF